MNFGICTLNSIALRAESNNSSEMVSQILFGETFKVIETDDNQWLKVILDYDLYQGWIMTNQISLINEDNHKAILANNLTVSNEVITFISKKNKDLQMLSLGVSLPFFKNGRFKLTNELFDFDGSINTVKESKKKLLKTAFLYLNSPFLWGGRTPFGIDCSGFTQMVYKINGYPLNRDASQQAKQGEVLSFIEESDPGDLAFFDDDEGEIIHVGIILANNYIIHCHEKVRIDRLDQSGIYNIDTQRHTHKLRLLKQIFK